MTCLFTPYYLPACTCELCLFGDIEALLHSLSLGGGGGGWMVRLAPRRSFLFGARARASARARGQKRGRDLRGPTPLQNAPIRAASRFFRVCSRRRGGRNLATACGHRIALRKWKETKQEPGTAEPGNRLGCCLISFHFLWAILCPQAVHSNCAAAFS